MDISSTSQIYGDNLSQRVNNSADKVRNRTDEIKNGKASEDSATEKEKKELKEACQGFEAIFLQSMMKSMRATLPGNSLFPDSQGMDIYTSLHDQYLTENLSKSGNATGIGEFLYRQLQDSL
ncbi:hypothetical protein MTBBW1_1730024 [Desulfamplus magnetovallimortis]|uniref:Flagellar protein FlgJ N-terminal domain-containing protein n=1 Tax=Desulfamplus magnetovallimortis TaxID=1246637 RepID=A0A1W1H9V8_9BACT|nr:rod-binding protein [Desulfamplus magnetovallimortis]SLM29226.1 hypothetical protein MTBBW1_1730024 [Desulfamplus magnetovallimortis]